MDKRMIFGAGGVLLALGLVTAAPPARATPPASATSAEPAMTCDQITTEIQSLSTEMEGFAGRIRTDVAQQRRASRRPSISSILGALPLPGVGAIIGQIAGIAESARRERGLSRQEEDLARIPELGSRLQALSQTYERQCEGNLAATDPTPAPPETEDEGDQVR